MYVNANACKVYTFIFICYIWFSGNHKCAINVNNAGYNQKIQHFIQILKPIHYIITEKSKVTKIQNPKGSLHKILDTN